MDYRAMAESSILNRADIADWIDSLIETSQFNLANDLVALSEGAVLPDAKLYRLAFYLLHCEKGTH